MNRDKLIELANTHGSVPGYVTRPYSFYPDQLNAFANAIIEECAKVCESTYKNTYPADRCAEAIRRLKCQE